MKMIMLGYANTLSRRGDIQGVLQPEPGCLPVFGGLRPSQGLPRVSRRATSRSLQTSPSALRDVQTPFSALKIIETWSHPETPWTSLRRHELLQTPLYQARRANPPDVRVFAFSKRAVFESSTCGEIRHLATEASLDSCRSRARLHGPAART